MITIVILESENRTYLVRCLNSIARQTFVDYKIILIGRKYRTDDIKNFDLTIVSNLNEALKQISTEKVMFVNMTSVLTPNCLERIVCDENSSIAQLYIKSGDEFYCSKVNQLRLTGRIFNTDSIIKLYDKKNGTFKIDDFVIASGQIEVNTNAVIYDSFEEDNNLVSYACDNIFPLLVSEEKFFVIKNVIANTKNKDKNAKIIEYINENNDDVELILLVANEYISNAYVNAIQQRDNNSYCFVKTFFESIVFEDVEKVKLANVIGIDEFQFALMQNHDLNSFLSIKKELFKQTEMGNNADFSLSGFDLAEFVVDKFESGCLGCMTIVKSFKAWLVYKVKK